MMDGWVDGTLLFWLSSRTVHVTTYIQSTLQRSGVFRISKRGAKFSLATSAHTKGEGQTKFSNFFLW